MWDPSFAGYQRRLDVFDYRGKHRDLPRDIGNLLALARDIELEDKIILDRSDKGS